MEFLKVDIENFKRFESLHLDLKPGINILLGGNGVGKTSALEALSVALSDFFNGISDVPKKGIEANQVRFDTHELGDVSTGKEYFSTSITSHIHLDHEVGIGQITRRDNTSNSRTRYLGKGIAQYANRICNDMNATLPLICYYSTKRLAPPKKENYAAKSKNKLDDRICGYIGCLDDTLDLKALKSWCLDMELEAFHAEKPVQEYEMFKNIISIFMSKMTNTKPFPTVYYSRKQEELCWMQKQRYSLFVCAKAMNRRDSSFPNPRENRKVSLPFPIGICLTRCAPSPELSGLLASGTKYVASGSLMRRPCALI